MRYLALLFALLILASFGYSSTILIPNDYSTIQEGIDAAVEGDTVLVAPNTYSGMGNTNLQFGRNQITLKSTGGAVQTIIDCGRGCRGVTINKNYITIEGFAFKRGKATEGGAIYVSNSGIKIQNCIFRENRATELQTVLGGAICIHHGAALIENCLFENNNDHH